VAGQIRIEGLGEALAEISDRLTAIEAQLAAASSNGHDEVGWYDLERAAHYLSLSKGALDRAVRRGTIECARTANGLRRFSKQMLDDYATGNGTKP
jgi:excisionase family DNA binding protein